MRKSCGLLNKLEILERYIILLLGVVDRPIPSILHLEKEIFILTRVHPKVSEYVTFIKHYKGPYSEVLNDLIRNPIFYPKAYILEDNKIYLTQEGKKIFKEIVKEHSKDEKFRMLLAVLKMIRELYDKLTEEELLFLIYLTYSDYKEKSGISDNLLKGKKRREIALRLLKKGLITEKRYKEIVEGYV